MKLWVNWYIISGISRCTVEHAGDAEAEGR